MACRVRPSFPTPHNKTAVPLRADFHCLQVGKYLSRHNINTGANWHMDCPRFSIRPKDQLFQVARCWCDGPSLLHRWDGCCASYLKFSGCTCCFFAISCNFSPALTPRSACLHSTSSFLPSVCRILRMRPFTRSYSSFDEHHCNASKAF